MKTGRNDPCPCGSGKKYKKCCEQKDISDRPKPIETAGVLEALQEALKLHKAGALKEAEDLYRKILLRDPGQADALHLLGLIYYDRREYKEAEEFLRKAIKIDPKAAFFYVNLGNTLKEQGKTHDAITQYKAAIRLDPSLAAAHYNLANELQNLENYEDAINSYKHAIKLNPYFAEAYFNMSKAQRAVGAEDEAIESLRKAIEINPDYYDAYFTLGSLFEDRKMYEEAVKFYKKALDINPEFSDAIINLANILIELERSEESESYCRGVIEKHPANAEAYNILSVAMRQQGRIKESIEAAQAAVNIKPDFASAYNNLGLAYREDGASEEAVAACRNAISITPGFAEAEWNLGLAYLQEGDFSNGWRQYEWRFLTSKAVVRQFPIPRWDGRSLEGKTLLVCAEQGIGDQVMFASIINDIKSSGAEIILECDARLRPLFTRSFKDVEVIPIIENTTVFNKYMGRDIDFIIPAGSLPGFFRPDISRFRDRAPYLKADPYRIQYWKDRFSGLGSGVKIGVSWRGGGEKSVRMMRSIPLAKWSAVLGVEGCHFISLQYGDASEEIRRAQEEQGASVHVFDEVDPLKNLDEFAAQISALDLVVSVDNSTVHIAGALGVPTIVLLPRGCDWRWLNEIEDSPWYESIRLIRQKEHLVWDDVIENLARLLKGYAAEKKATMWNALCSYSNLCQSDSGKLETTWPIKRGYPRRNYKCAVITPVGPGHQTLYADCRRSIEEAFATAKGCFSEILPIMIDDTCGKMGRSKARNIGISQAAEKGVEWLFFLDADDVMAPMAFEYAAPYLENYDAVWGSIWSNEKDRAEVLERPGQLPFLLDMDDLTACDPYTTLQIGHFVKLEVAQNIKFDEKLDVGEDFDYYLRVWERSRCVKIPVPFFYNIRGRHSEWPKSATSLQWRKAVIEMLNKHRRRKIIVTIDD